MDESKNSYGIPGAIIVAGLLIAAAVFLSGGGMGSGEVADVDESDAGLVTPVEFAQKVGVDKKDFEKCIADGGALDSVNEDLATFADTGLSDGTPTSLIIKEGLDGAMVVIGAQEVSNLSLVIDQVLNNDTSLEFNPQAGIGYTNAVNIELSDNEHIRGNVDAPVKLVEYSDLQCPFCSRFHPTVKAIVDQYNGQVAWVYRHLPLSSIHPQATPLAQGSECVAEIAGNDTFWEYIDLVFESQQSLI